MTPSLSFPRASRSFAVVLLLLVVGCGTAHLGVPSAPDFDGRAHASLESPHHDGDKPAAKPANVLGADFASAPSASAAPIAPGGSNARP
jgi:hypothetical protein